MTRSVMKTLNKEVLKGFVNNPAFILTRFGFQVENVRICKDFPELIPILGTDNCDICMEDITTHEATTLVCRHRFHSSCINKWINLRNHCPYCRTPVVLTNQKKEKDSC